MTRLWQDFDGEPFLINPGGELAIYNRPRPRRRRKVARKRRKVMARRTRVRRRRRVYARRRRHSSNPVRVHRRRRVYRRRHVARARRRRNPVLAVNPRRRRRRHYVRNRRRRSYSYRRNPLPLTGGMLAMGDIAVGVGAALVMNYATVPAANLIGVTDRFGLKFRGVQAGVGILPPILLAYLKVIPRSWAKSWIIASVGAVSLDLARDYQSGLLSLGTYYSPAAAVESYGNRRSTLGRRLAGPTRAIPVLAGQTNYPVPGSVPTYGVNGVGSYYRVGR